MSSNFDFSLEEVNKQLENEREAVARDLEDSTNDSYASFDDYMVASDYSGSDIFTPPDNVPAMSQEEHNELAPIVAGQARAWDIAKGVARNAQSAAEVEGIYSNVALIDARTAVTRQKAVNEGLRLIEATETGKLIASRTDGVVIATQMQNLKNAAGRELLVLEADKSNALIESAIADINAIRSSTESKLLEAEGKYLKGAGPNGSYDAVSVRI